jgi:hypothetical protein
MPGLEEPTVDVEEWVRKSREKQGLPPTIEDPAILEQLVSLLRQYVDELLRSVPRS